jgi:hypothetical protein
MNALGFMVWELAGHGEESLNDTISLSLTHKYITLHCKATHLPNPTTQTNPPPTTLPPSHTHKPMRFCILPNSFSFLAGSAAGGGGGGGASSLRPPPPLLDPPPMPPRPQWRAAATSLPRGAPPGRPTDPPKNCFFFQKILSASFWISRLPLGPCLGGTPVGRGPTRREWIESVLVQQMESDGTHEDSSEADSPLKVSDKVSTPSVELRLGSFAQRLSVRSTPSSVGFINNCRPSWTGGWESFCQILSSRGSC